MNRYSFRHMLGGLATFIAAILPSTGFAKHHSRSSSSSDLASCCKKNKVFQVGRITTNAIIQDEAGGSIPSDSNAAVGPDVIVAAVNTSFAIFDKAFMNRIFIEQFGNFWPETGVGAGDPQIMYDEISQRFFMTAWQNIAYSALLTVDAPPGAVGTYNGQKGAQPPSQVPFSITADIIATVPANADTTVTNDLTGAIALIATDGFATGSIHKCANAVAAGAIGCILYDSTGLDFSSINGSTQVPSMIVDYATGQILTSNLTGLHGTMANDPAPIFSNIMNIAVSKSPSPRSDADWYKYTYTNTQWNSVFETDYPKITVDQDYFYIVTQDFASDTDFTGEIDFVVLDKHSLVTGAGAVFVSESLVPQQMFVWPARFNLADPHTNTKRALFVSTNATQGVGGPSTALRIFRSPGIDYIDVPYPSPITYPYDIGPVVDQGPTVAPIENIPAYCMNPIISGNSLWLAQVWGLSKGIIRWYELDIADIDEGTISIKQWGDINSQTASGLAFPAINVDKEGNMAIAFTIGGPNQIASIGFTGRLKDDPCGKVRYPLSILEAGTNLYDGANQTELSQTFNRWGDYSSLIIDPKDHKTFYIFNQLASSDPADVDPSTNISYGWTTTLGTVKFKSNCKWKHSRKCHKNHSR